MPVPSPNTKLIEIANYIDYRYKFVAGDKRDNIGL